MQEHTNHAVHRHFAKLTSRVVAESGIPSDRYHLGKIILQCFKDDPNFISQAQKLLDRFEKILLPLEADIIPDEHMLLFTAGKCFIPTGKWVIGQRIDGGTGESDTNQTAMERSVKCAISLKNMGLQKGDVIVLMAPNHLDIGMPLYAGLYLGISVAAIDKTLGVLELKGTFDICKPKVIFCQAERTSDVQLALNEAELEVQIVTFDKSVHSDTLSFAELLENYGDGTSIDEFRPTDFDPADTFSFLLATSGTTGLPKAAALTHENFVITLPYFWEHFSKFPTPTRMWLLVSPLQWLTATLNFLTSPILKITRLQTSLPLIQNNIYDIINKYRPTYIIMSPPLMTSLLRPGDRERCDFTCFEVIVLGGSFVPQSLLEDTTKVTPQTKVCAAYGMSEIAGIAFDLYSGKPIGCLQYRLVNIETDEDIKEPNVPGELLLKGPGIFKGYYNNVEETENAFADDGWLRTGDMFYRDEYWRFIFVERIKSLLKYKNNQVSPSQIEEVIIQHPGVLDVAVTGIPDPECGDLPVACVVPKNGCNITAQEIKDLVKDTLSDSLQLRGGVIFLKQLPMTSTSKVHRKNLKELVLQMKRE